MTFYANDLQMGRPVENNGSRDLFPPIQNATIGSLEIGSEITRILEMFIYGAKITMEELYFNAPSLTLGREAEYDNICEGPFYQSKIGHLYLGEQVERIPAYCFIGAYLKQEELEIHSKSIGVRAFAGANTVIDTLPIGEEVETFESFTSGNLLFYRQSFTKWYLPTAE